MNNFFNYFEKRKKINDFLKFFRDIALENPNLSFNSKDTCNMIYNKLIRIGVKKEENQYDLRDGESPSHFKGNKSYSNCAHINSAFNNWLTYYHNDPGIDLIHSSDWSYFCQFISHDKKADNAKEHIKVYIPLDALHIEVGAKKIFNFLTDNHISHVSKTGREIRFDDIVVRLIRKEDADRLLDFIKKDSYIQKGLIKPNPFCFQKDGIALVCDGDESYNTVLTNLIDLYIAKKKKEKTLNKGNCDEFYKFVAIQYKNEFVNKNSKVLSEKLKIDSIEKMRNIREIIALILKSQDSKFSYEDYIDHFNKCCNSKQNRNQDTPTLMPEEVAIALVNEYVDTMCNNSNRETSLACCVAYFETGEEKYITRDRNLRERITNSSLRDTICLLARNNNYSLKQYIYNITTFYHTQK